MNRAVLIASVFSIALCHQAQGRITYKWTYEELRQKAELIVIAQPVEVHNLSEEFDLLHISTVDESGKRTPVKVLGVETKFEVLTILKGPTNIKSFILHHYRRQTQVQLEIGGPLLLEFDPKACDKKLLFLKKREDGQYEGVGGQTDLVYSIKNLGCL